MAKAMTKPETAATASDLARTITENDIARRAYDLYLARGCEHGHDVEDWLQAERELNAGSKPALTV